MGIQVDHIINKCKEGCRQSQKTLYMTFADDLMAVSIRYASDINEAKDILQNAFIKIFSQISTFDESKGSLKPWMSKIVVNEALQLIRKKKNVRFSQLELVHNMYAKEPDIFSQLSTEEITAMIGKLPTGYKIVFNMYVIEGFSHKEISEHLGIAESASRSQLSRAKKLLQELIVQHKMFKVC